MDECERRFRLALEREEKRENKIRTAKTLHFKGYSNEFIASQLHVTEGTVRYLLKEDI